MKQFTEEGIIYFSKEPAMKAEGWDGYLPQYQGEDKNKWYYTDQSIAEDLRPLVIRPKITGDFEKDVLSNFVNTFDHEEMDYIMKLKK